MFRFRKTAPLVTVLLSGSLAFVGCEDFVERPPQDQIPEDDFFRTEADFDLAAAGLYTPLSNQAWLGQEGWKIIEIPSDNSTAGGTDPDIIPIDNFVTTAENQNIKPFWDIRYRAVNLANVLMEKSGEGELDAAAAAPYIAEARFVRALAYFDLVRIFGAVPIVTERPVFGQDLLPARSPVDEVYDLIEADLLAAAADLPLTRGQSEAGRATSGAAKSLHAKVALTRDNFRLAYDLAAEVIASGVYDLVEDFGDLWVLETSDDNSEIILQAQHFGCGPFGTGNQMQAFYAPFGEGITLLTDGWGTHAPTSAGNAVSGTALFEEFSDDDLRRRWTFFLPGECYPEVNPQLGGYCYPESPDSRAGTAIKKYVVGGGDDVCFMSTPQNANILRYADVLLMLGEAAVGLGNGNSVNPLALESVNRVRERAGLEPLPFLNTENVLLERRLELAFEHQRWFDLLRLDPDRVVELLRLSGAQIPGPERLLFPLPAAELAINPNLTQNPGY